MYKKAKDPHGEATLAHASITHFLPVFYEVHKVTQSLIEIGYMTVCVMVVGRGSCVQVTEAMITERQGTLTYDQSEETMYQQQHLCLVKSHKVHK